MLLRFSKHYNYTSVVISWKLVAALIHNDAAKKYPNSVELWGVSEHHTQSLQDNFIASYLDYLVEKFLPFQRRSRNLLSDYNQEQPRTKVTQTFSAAAILITGAQSFSNNEHEVNSG